MAEFESIRLSGFDKTKVTPGSTPALWNVPIRLSDQPPTEWAEIFGGVWRTKRYALLRRAHVQGDSIVIQDCGLDEVAEHHLPRLKEAVTETNDQYLENLKKSGSKEERKRETENQHQTELDELEQKLKFDEDDPTDDGSRNG